jgi:NADPH:quinone reductase
MIVVYFGNASGPVPPFQINRLNPSNISIMRASVMGYIVTREELEYYAKETLERINDGRLRINIHKVYELEDVKAAHDDLEGRKTTGKLLLKL